MVHVVAFTGMPGSGKTEAVAVAQGRGLPILRMGDFVWEETKRRGLPLEDRHVGTVASEMRKSHGMGYWAQRTCDAIEHQYAAAPVVVVDGVRNYAEVEAFRRRLGDRFELIAVLSDTDERRERLLRRKRADDPSTREELEERDRRELGWGIAESIDRADHQLVNEGDIAAFREGVRRLLDQITASTH